MSSLWLLLLSCVPLACASSAHPPPSTPTPGPVGAAVEASFSGRLTDGLAELEAPDPNLSEPPAKPDEAPPPTLPERPPLSDEAKKKIAEYKALALKNDCSKGYPRLEGTWRFVGETRTPKYSDTIVITGTRFKETMSGEPDGQRLDAEINGEIRCLFKNRVLIEIDKVEPEGAYGNRSGDLYPCDLLSDMDPTVDRMLMICYFDWDLRTTAGLEFEFERVEDGKR